MSEVEKMYENAGVNKETECNEPSDVCSENGECDICFYANNYYPPFTAEKQLELLHLIITRIADIDRIYIECDNSTDKICFYSIGNEGDDCDTIEDALASYINDIWQDLTEQERKQIAEILRG